MVIRNDGQSVRFVSVTVVVLAIAVLALYGAPVAVGLFRSLPWTTLTDLGADGWVVPVTRSAVFACFAVLCEVTLGFLLAVGMLDICQRSPGHWTAVLLVPLLIGNTAAAFLFKIAVMDSNLVTPLIADRHPVPTWALILSLQLWQYLPPFTYLFFLRLRSREPEREDFARATGLSLGERLRDIYWPRCRDLAGLLTIFGFGEGLNEYAKSSLILRASAGTDTELISHRLQRYYENWRIVDPLVASESTLALAAVTTLIGIAMALIAAWSLCGLMDAFVRGLGPALCLDKLPLVLPHGLRVAMVVAAVAPFAYLLVYLRRWHFVDAEAFFRSAVLSALALAVTMVAVIAFALSARLLWPGILQRLDSRSLPFFGALYSLHLVPAIGIAFCGYCWIAYANLGASGTLVTIAVWLLAQAIIAFPLLASFVQVANFRVRYYELDFQRAARASWTEILSSSFLGRLRAEYVLILLFGFCIIWNEAVLNAAMSTLSRTISSIAVEISQRVSGRSAAYSEAAWAITASMVPIVAWLALWIAFLRRTERARAA